MKTAIAYALEVIEKRRPPLILGLTGPSGVGKTEIIKHLLDRHDFKSTHAGIPVKEGLAAGFGLKWDQVDGCEKNDSSPKLGGVEPKLVLDHMGEALARTAPLATSLALAKKIDKMHRNGCKLICVDGIRQQHEADLIHRRGGHIIRVDDGSGPDPKYPMDKRAWKIPADFNVDTSGTIPQSKGQVDKIMAKLRLEHPCFTRHSHSDISKDWSQFDQERGAGEKTGRAAGSAAGVYGAGRAFRAVRRIAGNRGLRRGPALTAGAVAAYGTYQAGKAVGGYIGRKVDQAVGRVFKRDTSSEKRDDRGRWTIAGEWMQNHRPAVAGLTAAAMGAAFLSRPQMFQGAKLAAKYGVLRGQVAYHRHMLARETARGEKLTSQLSSYDRAAVEQHAKRVRDDEARQARSKFKVVEGGK